MTREQAIEKARGAMSPFDLPEDNRRAVELVDALVALGVLKLDPSGERKPPQAISRPQ